MRKQAVVGVCAALVLATAAGAAWWHRARLAEPTQACALRFSGGVAIEDVPLAETEPQIVRGLAGRDDAGVGMLFRWPHLERRAFWMKGTQVPLSIAFIGAENRVIELRDMEPFSEQPHAPAEPARMALEVPRGTFDRLGIKAGSRLIELTCKPLAR
jgi:uncharacterized membrane protein (UPF0127 family)